MYLCISFTASTPLLIELTTLFQKILSTSYGSFSLVGLYSIFITGFIITVASYLLEPVSSFLCKKGYRQYAHLEWTTNTVLQLQRLAHEELGLGTWSGCADTVPTTKASEAMASLNITDIHHPVLCRQEKQEDPEIGHILQATAKSQDSTTSAGAADFEESRGLALSEISSATLAQNPELQEDVLSVAAHGVGGMKDQQVHELDDGETEVSTNRLSRVDGTPLLDHKTREETKTIASRDLSQTGASKMGSAVAVSSTAVNTSATSAAAADIEIFTPLSQPVPKLEAVALS